MDNPDNIKKEIGRYKKDVVIDQKELDREKLIFINQIKNGYGNQIKININRKKNISWFKRIYIIIKQFIINHIK